MNPEHGNFSEVLEHAPAGCLLLDGEVIKEVNSLAVEIMNIPESRMLNIPLVELLVPEFEQPCKKLFENLGGTPNSIAVRLAAGLKPIELVAMKLQEDLAIVWVRSMVIEHNLSAQACGDLTHDKITGLPDHYHVLYQLHNQLNSLDHKPLALLCIWVDELAGLADTYGHRAVHRVVRDVGKRLQIRLRGPDTLGRFDESGFLAVIHSDSSTDELTMIAERLRDEVAFPVAFDGGLVSFTASVVIGTVTYEQPSIERILALLEAAANRAVHSGGNRTEVLSL